MKKINSTWLGLIYVAFAMLFYWWFIGYSEKGYLDYDIEKLNERIKSYQPYLGIGFILIFLLLIGAFKNLKSFKKKIFSWQNILLFFMLFYFSTNYTTDFLRGINKIYKTKEIERKVASKYVNGVFFCSYFENDSIKKKNVKGVIPYYDIIQNYKGKVNLGKKREGILVSDIGLFGVPFNPRWKEKKETLIQNEN